VSALYSRPIAHRRLGDDCSDGTSFLRFSESTRGATGISMGNGTTVTWLQSVELHRRVHAGLNKGEACNALARAVFLCSLG
jgi:hypothetical protein